MCRWFNSAPTHVKNSFLTLLPSLLRHFCVTLFRSGVFLADRIAVTYVANDGQFTRIAGERPLVLGYPGIVLDGRANVTVTGQIAKSL